MKEFHSPSEPYPCVAPIPIVVQSRRHRETPRWIVAKSQINNTMQLWQNDAAEFAYHHVISVVKQLIATYGGDTVFECDERNNADSFTGMHTFITSSFNWRLDCELAYNYEVYYCFHNCPYEAEVRQMMVGYPLDRTTHEKKVGQSYPAFYKRVLEIQDPIHITAIKAQG